MIQLITEYFNYHKCEIEIFDRHRTLADWEAKIILRDLKKLINRVQSDKTVSTEYLWDNLDISEYISGFQIMQWYEKLTGITDYDELEDSVFVFDEEETNTVRDRMQGHYRQWYIDNYRCGRYSDQFIDDVVSECDRCIEELTEYLQQYETAKSDYEAEQETQKNKMLNGVDWTTEERNITDEGGRTKEYIHTIRINGKTYTIVERNVFDFGRVLNSEDHGVYTYENGEIVCDFMSKGSTRQVTEDEARAVEIIWKYGAFSDSPIRM